MTRLPMLDPWHGVLTVSDAMLQGLNMHPTHLYIAKGATLKLRTLYTAGGVLRIIEIIDGDPNLLIDYDLAGAV